MSDPKPGAADPTAATGTVLVEVDGSVMSLILSNPGSRNAMSPSIYSAGLAAIERASTDPAIRAVLIYGADGFFCAGGNLNRLLGNRERDPSIQRDSIDQMHGWIRALRQCPKPIIAAVEGAAAGAGFSVALACDLIVADRDARFVMAYSRVGLSPDGGASAALSMALPPQRAFAVLALAEPISADELKRSGIVHEVAQPGTTIARGLELARRLADGPTGVYGRIKQLLVTGRREPLVTLLDAERDAFVTSLFDSDAAEGISAFLAKRPPRFTGR